MQNVITRRFMIAPAFEIYGGVAGLYDLGPIGTYLRHNIVKVWRSHFVVEDDLLEVQCTCLVPEPVLVTSGHVAKFADLMVKDTKTGECFRADKLIEQQLGAVLEAEKDDTKRHLLQIDLNSADGLSAAETSALLSKYNLLSPRGNALSAPFAFNLMFQTTVGPDGRIPAYLRPETAYGIFMNFRRALEQARSLPFGIAQVGTAFRNEIAPRNGLLRVREFEQAEIEYFIYSRDAPCKHFSEISDEVLVLFSAEAQLSAGEPVSLTARAAVECGLIAHETLAYFMAKTLTFLVKIGLKRDRLRFRQHLPKQLAHYARDCWDCDCLLESGWTEIVGIADRSAFDLQVHSRATGVDLSYFAPYDTPREEQRIFAKPIMKEIGKSYKQSAYQLKKWFEDASQAQLAALKREMEQNGSAPILDCQITPQMVELTEGTATVHGEQITPITIEPSFGIGRILWSVLEHSFYTRDGDENRAVFAFPATVSPVALGIAVLQTDDRLCAIAETLVRACRKSGIYCKYDDSAVAIGKKYARFDEIGVSYVVTIDFDSLEDNAATVRERDSMTQQRIQVAQIVEHIKAKMTE